MTITRPDAEAKIADWKANLPRGWDSYDALPPNDEAVRLSALLLDALDRNPVSLRRVAPSCEGGVAFVFTGEYADVEVFNSGEILAATTNSNARPIDVWEIAPDPDALDVALARIKAHIEN